MGRLSEFFNQHRDNVEDAVERALDKADNTIDSLSRRVEELEQKLRDVAGEKPVNKSQDRDADLTRQNAENGQAENQGVVTSNQFDTNDGPVHEGTKKQNRTKKQ